MADSPTAAPSLFGGSTPAPSPFLHDKLFRYWSEGLVFLVIVVARTGIGFTAARRLISYYRNGVLRLGEIKCVFHAAMLLAVILTYPRFMFCGIRYKDFQCWIQRDQDPLAYYTEWRLYGIYRMGIPLQLVCLSLTVLMWDSFLLERRRISEFSMPGVSDSGLMSRRYRSCSFALMSCNGVSILGTLVYTVLICVNPNKFGRAESESTEASTFLLIFWFLIGIVQLSLALFLLKRGLDVQRRINRSHALDQAERQSATRRVIVVISAITVCLTIGVFSTVIITLPLFVDGPQPPIQRFFEERFVLFEVISWILPHDVVDSLLLWLMRAPPQRPQHLTSVQSEGPEWSTDTYTASLLHPEADPDAAGEEYIVPGHESLTDSQASR